MAEQVSLEVEVVVSADTTLRYDKLKAQIHSFFHQNYCFLTTHSTIPHSFTNVKTIEINECRFTPNSSNSTSNASSAPHLVEVAHTTFNFYIYSFQDSVENTRSEYLQITHLPCIEYHKLWA